jgi:hypothetical protein
MTSVAVVASSTDRVTVAYRAPAEAASSNY